MIFVNLGILSNHCFGELPVRIGFGLDIAQVLTKGFMAGHSKGVRSSETKRHAEHLYDAIRLGGRTSVLVGCKSMVAGWPGDITFFDLDATFIPMICTGFLSRIPIWTECISSVPTRNPYQSGTPSIPQSTILLETSSTGGLWHWLLLHIILLKQQIHLCFLNLNPYFVLEIPGIVTLYVWW